VELKVLLLVHKACNFVVFNSNSPHCFAYIRGSFAMHLYQNNNMRKEESQWSKSH
jgi:hypothetical protein